MVERKLAGCDASLEHGKRRAPVGARQRPGLDDRSVHPFGGLGERAQQLDSDQRHVGRNDDAELGARESQPRRQAHDRGSLGATVVVNRERKRQGIVCLADGEHGLESLSEDSMGANCERLAAKARESFRRPKPRARAPDEQNAGYALIRHGSE